MDRKRIFQGIWLIVLYFSLTYIGTTALSTLSLDYQVATVSAANDPGNIIRLGNYQSLKNQRREYRQSLAEVAYKQALYTLLLQTVTLVQEEEKLKEKNKSSGYSMNWPCTGSDDDVKSLKQCLAAGLRSYIRDENSIKFDDILDKVGKILRQQKTDMELISLLEPARRLAVENNIRGFIRKIRLANLNLYVNALNHNMLNAEVNLGISRKELQDLESHLNKVETFVEQVGHNTENWMRVDLFYKISTISLIMIATLCMGAIGSLVTLTRQYYAESVQSSTIIIQPLLGALTALAILIFFKSGQIVVAAGTVTPGADDLVNPFFIAFLGFISGSLSDQAFEAIREKGTRFFGQNSSSKRWAMNLQEIIHEEKKDINDLQEYADLKLIEKWIKGEQPVPEVEQKIIAAWLNRDLRTLFTDIPPGQINN